MDTPHFPGEEGESPLRGASLTLLYTLLVFAVAPVFPALWDYTFGLFPYVLEKLVSWLVILAGLSYFAFFIYVKRIRSLLFYFSSAILFVFYFFLVYFLCGFPAERFHVPEYGVLSILTYRWFRVAVKREWVYPAVLGYTFLVGTIDETIQYFLPERFFGLKDMAVNWISAFLTTCLMAFAERAKRPWLSGT